MIHVAADAIAFHKGKLVLVDRKHDPRGIVMPGGHLEEGESLEECAVRELREETDLRATSVRQFHTYSAPDRDPRGRFVTTVFVCEAEGEPRSGDDAKAIVLLDPKDIDAHKDEFAFDHYAILKEFLKTR